MIKRIFWLTLIIWIVAANLFFSPSLAQPAPLCQRQEEIFMFELANYATQSQGGSILNLKVAYRFAPDAIAQRDYPDLLLIKQDIDSFFANYENKADYWEIVNKNLVQYILNKYPQLSSLSVKMDVLPSMREPFSRSSIVKSTRPQSCDLSFVPD